jgi:hypothetical protein
LERNKHLQVIPVKKVSGGALFGDTAALKSLGPFDESFFLYGEDVDLSLRARRSGLPLTLVPNARVLHDAGYSQRTHAPLVERARCDAALRLIHGRWGRVGALAGIAELLPVTLLGMLKQNNSSHSARARAARFVELIRWARSLGRPRPLTHSDFGGE